MVPLPKILYLTFDYTPHDHRFLSALSQTEHEVYFARLQRGQRQTEDRPIPANIDQVQWSGGQTPFAWGSLPGLVLDLRRVLDRIRPDLVHAGPIQTCGLLATLTGYRPRLIMSWGFDLMQDCDRNAWWRWATRFVLERATFFTSDCEVTRNRAVSFGMDPGRTVVFPWGVDLEHFKPLDGDKRKRAQGHLLFCNRAWEPRYGVEVLARAFIQVARERQDVSLLLLGGGSQAGLIRQILEKGGVLERVTFAGQVSQKDLPRYYHLADLYVSPSHVDGSSVSLMEALACGLPCLVSDIPANREWVIDGENGWLFPDGEADMLAARILQVLADPESLKRFPLAARGSAEAKADWRKNFSILLGAYRKTIQLEAR